jgi:uncharacterized repeat protein (TIGR03803 family)
MKAAFINRQTAGRVLVSVAICLAILILRDNGHAQAEAVLYTFTGSSDGGAPYSGLISDKYGNLYGTASEYGNGPCAYPFRGCGGVVFQLAPVENGSAVQWTFNVLYAFRGGSDGAHPANNLALDSLGNLFGTTAAGGTGCGGLGCGTIFELQRSSDEWVEKVLYRFTGGFDGSDPLGSLTLDQQGNVYGTTAQGGGNACVNGYGTACGVVFRLSPIGAGTKTSWVETVLHRFHGADGANPYVGVTLAPPELCGASQHGTGAGKGKVCVFGTATNGAYTDVEPGGVVFQISPGLRTWNYKTVYEFPGGCGGPGGPLILDKSGTLYGMTHLGGQYCSGSVFTLSKDSATGTWSETDIYSFSGPGGWFPVDQGVVMDQHGNLYGTTSAGGTSSNCQAGCGTVFRLTKAVGSGWYESALYSMEGGAQGIGPVSGNVLLRDGKIYGTTPQGGDMNCSAFGLPNGCGVIYSLGP